jgi:hypothetical protein
MKTAMKIYQRPDGVVGCGFYGEFGGLWQHSIAWPDQSATRMRFEDLEERQIDVKQVAVVGIGDRDLIDMANAPARGYETKSQKPVEAEVEATIVESAPVDPPAPEDAAPFDPSTSEAENIRRAIALDPDATNKDIISLLNSHGIDVSSSQVTRERRAIKAASEETAV